MNSPWWTRSSIKMFRGSLMSTRRKVLKSYILFRLVTGRDGSMMFCSSEVTVSRLLWSLKFQLRAFDQTNNLRRTSSNKCKWIHTGRNIQTIHFRSETKVICLCQALGALVGRSTDRCSLSRLVSLFHFSSPSSCGRLFNFLSFLCCE